MEKRIDIITFGVPMVEFTRRQLDSPLWEYGELLGPFAAGDPGITLNACATLGYKGCYVGVVGKDDFAECFMRQMRLTGIDTSHLRVDETCGTGVSILANFSDGSRRFFFTVPSSAAAKMGAQDIDDELIAQTRWIHFSGFAISISDSIAEMHAQLMERIPDDVMVSFDPNYRAAVTGLERYKRICAPVFERCDLFLPSRREAKLFCPEAEDEMDACRRIAARGKKVALKDGARGCDAFDGGLEMHIPSFPARELDPTGAGDTFGGALIAALMDGADLFTAARYGAAAGSIAVSRVGLMDIAPTRDEIDAVLKAAAHREE